MIEKTKAAFRAVREECGLTNQDVADEAGASLAAVRKWEYETRPYNQPPDDVWAWLLACREGLYEEARRAVNEALAMHRGDAPVVLTYYRTQEQLDARQLAAGMDRPVGYINAITREVARQLCDKHVDVVLAYPADEMD